MMDILPLQEVSCTNDLLPFTATRSVLDIRMGVLTLREKWERLLGPNNAALTEDPDAPALPANILPTRALAARIREEFSRASHTQSSGDHGSGQSTHSSGDRGSGQSMPSSSDRGSGHHAHSSSDRAGGPLTQAAIDRIITHGRLIRYPWHIFQHNAEAIIEDYEILTAGRHSQPIPPTVQAVNPESIFIEFDAKLSNCILNASTGPIYIGRDVEIMDGALIRGPFAAGEGAVVKMGAKIYGGTTVGDYSVVGGEIKNTVIFGCSNKGHDGYLGDAVIGEWCNLGAGTSASNLKNNAADVRVWHPSSGGWLNAGPKCGLLMGDYSRSAVNTTFDTGTIVGVCCNIFGTGTPPKYVPDFSWGVAGTVVYEWDKALRDIANWKRLKNQTLSEGQIQRLKHIFDSL